MAAMLPMPADADPAPAHSGPADATHDLPEPWRTWAAGRPDAAVVHLDTASAGRSATSTLAAVVDHLRLEATVGPPVAAERVESVLEQGRGDIGGLLGLPAAGVAFVGSASEALQAMLAVWPFGASATVGVVPAEWGPNLAAFSARGLRIVELPVDASGRVDLAGLEKTMATEPPTVVHLTQVTSHRALVQPVAEAVAICRRAGVPVWVDAAQAFGHVDTATGADVVYATSRKWMCGPRGVAVLGVAEQWWPALRLRPSVLAASGLPPMRALEPSEANIAGRLGLCDAVDRHLGVGPEQTWARLSEVGRLTRTCLADTVGWQVLDAVDVQGAITALRPTAGQDVAVVRARLLNEFGIVTTAAPPLRAPRDMSTPLLRVSPHADCRVADLVGLRTVLGDL